MGFDEEWGRLRARAAEQHGSSMSQYLDIQRGLANTIATATTVPGSVKDTPPGSPAFKKWVESGDGAGEVRHREFRQQHADQPYDDQFLYDMGDDLITLDKKSSLHFEQWGAFRDGIETDPLDGLLGVMSKNPDAATPFFAPDGREDHAVPDGLRRPLGTALQGHALDVYENLNALDFVYSNASAPSAAVWKDGKGYHFAVAQKPVIRVIRAVSDDPAVYAGLRTALTAEGAGRLAAVPGDATGASLTAGPAVFARVMGTLDGIAAHTAGSGEPGTKWYAAVVAALSQDGATAADPTADVAGHLTGTWRQRLRTLPGKETGAGALTGQCEEFFTTWADLKDVPEAEREPALRSCRSGAWTTSQRALKDLGD